MTTRPFRHECIVIGVSAGGMEALQKVLTVLDAGFSLPVVIVQHEAATSGGFLAHFLAGKCALPAKQAEDKEKLVPGTIYVAPPDYHLLIENDRTLALSIDAPVNYARPSIDVLFETAADAYGRALAGVILTGASVDGSRGLKKIKDAGGLTIVQDPQTAEASYMPRAALAAVEVDYVLKLEEIGHFLSAL